MSGTDRARTIIEVEVVDPPVVTGGPDGSAPEVCIPMPERWRFRVDGHLTDPLVIELHNGIDQPIRLMVDGNRVTTPTELHVNGVIVAVDEGLFAEKRRPW